VILVTKFLIGSPVGNVHVTPPTTMFNNCILFRFSHTVGFEVLPKYKKSSIELKPFETVLILCSTGYFLAPSKLCIQTKTKPHGKDS
jgi:hypothetical protein